MISTKSYYQQRFSAQENTKRQAIWKVLCRSVFQQFIDPSDVVADIGAGYCEFINNIVCDKKIAVDINPDTQKNAGSEVKVLLTEAVNIPKQYDGKIDCIFMSNFLEHLPSREAVLVVLKRAHKLLSRGGKILILQPNIDLTHEHYWDFLDHHVALNEKSLREALGLGGFTVTHFIKRFLPYTTKSNLPKSAFLVRLYLMIPASFRPFAGQSFCVGKKS